LRKGLVKETNKQANRGRDKQKNNMARIRETKSEIMWPYIKQTKKREKEVRSREEERKI
jgi:hypothetical protein